MNWEQTFTDAKAVFKHDGNLARPYIRLTSGRITNEYFNSRVIVSRPRLFAGACNALLGNLFERCDNRASGPDRKRWYVVGAARGGIVMAIRCGEVLRTRAAYAEKEAERLVFKDFRFEDRCCFIPVEDAVTTLGTVEKLRAACAAASCDCTFIGRVFAFWNWTGEDTFLNYNITSLVKRKLLTWEEGSNPFTGGAELVRPIERPKEHWDEVIRAF